MSDPGPPEQGTGGLARLRAGAARLTRGSGDAPANGLGRRRRIAVWTCVIVATLLTLVLSLTVWAKRQVLDENNWANTSTQLLQNEQVRSSLSQYLVDQLYDNVDVSGVLAARLPEQAKALAPALASGLEQLAVRGANELLQRPRVVALWKGVNRRAVRSLVAVLDGKTVAGVARAERGEVVVDLRPLVQNLAGRFGVSQDLPADAGRLVVLRSNQIKAAQDGLKAVRVLSILLVILVLALWVAAVWLARGRRRRTIRSIAWGLVAVGIVLLVVRRVAGRYTVDALIGDNPAVKPAASDAWSISTELLKQVAIVLIVYGALAVLACWLAGRTRPAVAVRRALAPTLHRRPWVVFIAVFVVWVLVLLLGPSAGGRTFFGVLLLFVLLMAGVEVLRRQTLREFPDAKEERPLGRVLWDMVLGAGRRGRGDDAPPDLTSPVDARLARLERLGALRDSGTLSPAEFEAQKTLVLSSGPTPP